MKPFDGTLVDDGKISFDLYPDMSCLYPIPTPSGEEDAIPAASTFFAICCCSTSFSTLSFSS